MPFQIITEEFLRNNLEKARYFQHLDAQRIYPEVDAEKSDDENVKTEIYHGITSAGISSGLGPMLGIRQQEDRAFIAELHGLEMLTPIELAQLFNDALLDISERCQSIKAGSTYLGCLLWDRWIITANVGDSYALLLEKHDGVLCASIRLNWPHKPTDPEELERIQREGGIVGHDHRLNGRFSVSRAVGDAIDPPGYRVGLISLPSLSLIERPLHGGYLILGSDGLSDVVSVNEMASFFRGANQSEPELANALRRYSFQKGSTDNTTVIVAAIPPRPDNRNAGILLSIADGHGGDEVSEYLKQNFANCFQQKIKQRNVSVLDHLQRECEESSESASAGGSGFNSSIFMRLLKKVSASRKGTRVQHLENNRENEETASQHCGIADTSAGASTDGLGRSACALWINGEKRESPRSKNPIEIGHKIN